MPIGTSDGKYYEDEMAFHLDHLNIYPSDSKFDDGPTFEQKMRTLDTLQYSADTFKLEEQEMEERLIDGDYTADENAGFLNPPKKIAMDDFEKKGMTSGKIPEIQGGGVSITNNATRKGYANDDQINSTPYEDAVLNQNFHRLGKIWNKAPPLNTIIGKSFNDLE